MKAEQLPFYLTCSSVFFLIFVQGGGADGGGLLFVVVTDLNPICNGYQVVWVFTIANGENKSVFDMFIIWLTFVLSRRVISLIMRGFAAAVWSSFVQTRLKFSGL